LKTLLKPLQYFLLIASTLFCTSCATSVGMAAAAVTNATISVGTAVVTAPFKIVGAMNDDDDGDNEESDEFE
jgi:hypothetical protein